jgi:hypothetical protein
MKRIAKKPFLSRLDASLYIHKNDQTDNIAAAITPNTTNTTGPST